MSFFLGDLTQKVDMDSPLPLIGTIFLGIVGAAVFLVQPGYVQGLVQYRGFTDVEAGYLASADMAGMAAATIYVSFKMGGLKWRLLMFVSLLIMTLGNILSAFITHFEVLLVTRFIIGLGEGGVVPLTFAAIALTSRKDRNFGLYISGCLTYAAFALVAMPKAYQWWGMEGIFLFFAALSAAALFFVKYMPVEGHEDFHGGGRHVSPQMIFLALTAMFSYFLAQGIAWAYLFLIGTSGGLSEQAVANGLTLSQFLGIAGALTAAAIAGRFGRVIPLSIGIGAGIVSLGVLFGEFGFFLYALAVGVFNYAWNMVHPYLLASMASFDDTGKIVVWAVVMQTLGLGIGPSIGASVIMTPGVYDNINWAAMVFFMISLLCILPPLFASGANRFNLVNA